MQGAKTNRTERKKRQIQKKKKKRFPHPYQLLTEQEVENHYVLFRSSISYRHLQNTTQQQQYLCLFQVKMKHLTRPHSRS